MKIKFENYFGKYWMFYPFPLIQFTNIKHIGFMFIFLFWGFRITRK
jgi:hypothetical protein